MPISHLYKVHCRHCRREDNVDLVTRHLDGHILMRCQHCHSTDVKIVEIDAHNGELLDRVRFINRRAHSDEYRIG